MLKIPQQWTDPTTVEKQYVTDPTAVAKQYVKQIPQQPTKKKKNPVNKKDNTKEHIIIITIMHHY